MFALLQITDICRLYFYGTCQFIQKFKLIQPYRESVGKCFLQNTKPCRPCVVPIVFCVVGHWRPINLLWFLCFLLIFFCYIYNKLHFLTPPFYFLKKFKIFFFFWNQDNYLSCDPVFLSILFSDGSSWLHGTFRRLREKF